jgi:DNA-binding transcriptional LysR family regulator
MISTSMRRLEVFLAVAETGRFSQAAERLGIAQPSVSAHIAGLERQVGQPLFLRAPGRPATLSQAGQSLLAYAREVLRRSRETADALKSMSTEGIEELTIAAQRSIANRLLPPLLAEFMRARADTKIIMNSEIQENVIALIVDRQVDIGLFFGLHRVSTVPSELVGHQKLAIVVSPDHELALRTQVTPDELEKFPFVGGLPSSSFGNLVGTLLRKMGIRNPQYSLRLQDATALTGVARRGLGVLCTPLCNVEADIKAGLLQPVAMRAPPLSLQIRLAFSQSKQTSRAAQQFAEFLRTSDPWAEA